MLNKKTPSYNNFIERAKTPSSKYINKSSTKAIMNKNQENNENKKSHNYNSIITTHNDINMTQNSVLNKASKDYLTTLEKKNIINNIKNSINSMKINTNSIKRINKPYININKKRNIGISENHPNTKIRQKSSMGIKKYNNKNAHIYFKNNINNNDLTNFNSNKNAQNNFTKYQQNKMNFDLNKELSDINLTCIDENRNIKNSLYKMQKITTENDNQNDTDKSNLILPSNKNNNNRLYSNKYSVTFNDNINNNNINNNNIKNSKKMLTNKIKDYNYMIPNQNMNNNNISNIQNNQIMQYAKKLNARSNSYRITSHGNTNGYINKKRKLNYKYDLTQPEEKIKNNLQLNTSKAKNSQIINYSLINNGVNFMNLNPNEPMNNKNITNNKFDEGYIMNTQNSSKTPQIFNQKYNKYYGR
jgi:hypothetical protein